MLIAMKLMLMLCGFLILAASSVGQTQKHDPCDPQMTFCWYGPYDDGSDEVDAWGQNWTAQDASEKPLKVPTAIRCVKRLHVCLKSNTHDIGGKTMTRIDILPVRSWNAQQGSLQTRKISTSPARKSHTSSTSWTVPC